MLQVHTLLLKLMRMEEIGCSTDMGGTALLSFLYHVSISAGSPPVATSSSRSICSSDERM